MGYTDRTVDHSSHTYSQIGAWYTSSSEESEEELQVFNHKPMLPKPRHLRRLSLQLEEEYDSLHIEPSEFYLSNEFRQRSNSLPPGLQKKNMPYQEENDYNTMSDRKLFAIMTNLIHIIIGIAMTQLGIVGTWYQRYMNFEKEQLRHVLYICLMFIVLGVYGMCIIMKRLGDAKSHQIVYSGLSILTIVASGFITTNGIHILVSEAYKTNQMVIIIFDALIVGLSGMEMPAVLIGLYATVRRPSMLSHTLSDTRLADYKGDKSPSSWNSITSIILNVAHIVLGLCIAELGMVGVMYRKLMNIDSNGLLVVVFTSLSFISVGIIGIYNHTTGKSSRICNRSMYTCASLLAIGSAITIMTLVYFTLSSKQYYAGVEAVEAFDVMIFSMSGMELVVGISATALCILPFVMAKMNSDN